ncbi:MAG TPA: hypothetical protein VMU04_13630 [Candidatus Acidoferrum sp.]|nr:hypothetical protein [Candidatus Acidoferrum sp.]
MPPRKCRLNRRQVRSFAVGAALLGGLYWWLVAKTDLQQLIAAGILCLVVAAALAAVAASAGLSFTLQWSWLGLLARKLPAKVLRDLGLVAFALWKATVRRTRLTGGYHRLPFNPGGADTASKVRRALVLGAISLPPNSFALGTEDRRSLLVHQLVPQPEPAGGDWPI